MIGAAFIAMMLSFQAKAGVENLPVADVIWAKDVQFFGQTISGQDIDRGAWQQDRAWIENILRTKMPRACNTCLKITYEPTGFKNGLVAPMSPGSNPLQIGGWVKKAAQVVVFRVDNTKQYNVYPKPVDPPYIRSFSWIIPPELLDGNEHSVCSAVYKPGPRDPTTGKLTWELMGALDNVSCAAGATRFIIKVPQ
jgi:hypothetical protein